MADFVLSLEQEARQPIVRICGHAFTRALQAFIVPGEEYYARNLIRRAEALLSPRIQEPAAHSVRMQNEVNCELTDLPLVTLDEAVDITEFLLLPLLRGVKISPPRHLANRGS